MASTLRGQLDQSAPQLRVDVGELHRKVPERRRTVAIEHAVHRLPAQLIDQGGFGVRRAVDVLAAALLACEQPPLEQPAHDRHDRRISVTTSFALLQILDDFADGGLAASDDDLDDRRGKWSKNVPERRSPGSGRRRVGHGAERSTAALLPCCSDIVRRVDWLLGGKPFAPLAGATLVGLAFALVAGLFARARSARRVDSVGRIVLADSGTAALAWAAAAAIVLGGSIANVDGLRMPFLSIIVLGSGGNLAFILARRWRHLTPTRSSAAAADASSSSRPRLIATTWEVGLAGAAAGAFALYALTIGHATLAQPWGHPIHWIVALVGGAVGYAAGLGLATPRYTVRSRSK